MFGVIGELFGTFSEIVGGTFDSFGKGAAEGRRGPVRGALLRARSRVEVEGHDLRSSGDARYFRALIPAGTMLRVELLPTRASQWTGARLVEHTASQLIPREARADAFTYGYVLEISSRMLAESFNVLPADDRKSAVARSFVP
jgi:hypothetical protein